MYVLYEIKTNNIKQPSVCSDSEKSLVDIKKSSDLSCVIEDKEVDFSLTGKTEIFAVCYQCDCSGDIMQDYGLFYASKSEADQKCTELNEHGKKWNTVSIPIR
ncbi:MAG: hypothetical protein Q4B64_09750 [Spirochaetales bacterium]|nr:hypothetical protein [Spirochaetales bacterium]